MYLTQCIKRNAQVNKNGIATVYQGRERSWPEFVDRVSRAGGAIKQRIAQPGERVAILALNSDRYFEYYFASWWAGAVVIPMNIRWSAAEHVYSLKDSGATVLFVDEQFKGLVGEIRAEVPGLHTIIYLGDENTPPDCLDYENLIEETAPIPDQWRGGEDLAGLFYTGGTTGFPKGVMLPHRALWASSVSIAWHGTLSPETRYLHAAPMFHLADMAMGLASTIAGASQIFITAFEPRATIDTLISQQITNALLVPTMIKMTLDQMRDEDADGMHQLNQIFFGASPMPQALLEEAIVKLPKVKWSQLYGQTELAPLATFQPPEYCTTEGENSAKMNSAGQAGLCVELQVVDESSNEVPRGTVGEIRVRGANVMQGYWNKPEETKVALIDGWVNTGDAGYMDEDGFIFIADRLKDMIITGGENVFSAEVESTLSTHPAVSECAVIGVPSDEWGEAVHAIVIAKSDIPVTEQELVEHCGTRIAHYKCPRSIEFRTDPMPLSGAGKVMKRELRKPYWAGVEKQIN